MLRLGPTELFIILIIVLVLFGGGRISRLGSELGSAITNFRKGINEGQQEAEAEAKKKENETF
ncbi:MAG: twin-arginine translocase TatA/TatE family subunit [Chitinophagaceae bacterium]|nr:twin-arginine translocase TatA/TatE family subunit [Anaerolineae bacterium]